MKKDNEKLTFKEHVKKIWEDYKVPVKVGCTCLFLGTAYGFVKGMNVQRRATYDLMYKIPQLPAPDDCPLDEVLEGCSKSDVM